MRALLWLLWAAACCSSSSSSSSSSSPLDPSPSLSPSPSSPISSAPQKPAQVTRTALHVARSLDPSAMETMTVRTKTGDVATLLVKKREGRHGTATLPHAGVSPSENTVYEKISVGTSYGDSKNGGIVETRSPDLSDQKKNEIDHHDSEKQLVSISNTTRSSKSTSQLVPDPVYVRSTPMLVKGHSQAGHLYSAKRGRSLLKIDADGIPVVTGVRVPDDESDRQVWRNARVINGILMPYDKDSPKHSFNLPAQNYPEKKKVHQSQANWIKMEQISKPTPTVLKPVIKDSIPSAAIQADSWLQSTQIREDPLTVVKAPSPQQWHQQSQEVVKVIDDSQPNLPEEDKYLRDRILDYIKSVNKQEVIQKRVPVSAFRDSRGMTHDDIVVPPVEGEARMLFRADAPSEDLPMEARMAPSDVLPMEARMLQVPGASVYPTSILYSPAGSPEATRVVSPVEEGVRTPVLQYAHPELGVQPAAPESRVRGVDEFDDQSGAVIGGGEAGAGGREQALAYFSHDIHADRSPFAFEPGLEDEARVAVDRQHSQRSHSPNPIETGPLPRPKKIDPPRVVNSHQYYIAERPASDPNIKYYTKFADVQYAGPDNRDRPFWERIGDTIREHVQTGVDRMTEMTRPVMEPLVEATHKISHNLGLGTDREMGSFKEKLGVVGTPSVFLPALGLVAGGAALGLGAVAVGRYLDVDMLKRSGAGDAEIERLQLEHKRAMEALDRGQLPAEVTGRGHDLDRSALAQFTLPSTAHPTAHPSSSHDDVGRHTETSTSKPSSSRRRRRRRDVLQHLDHQEDDKESTLLKAGLGDASLWTDTPCAKRTFCQVMLSQPGDDVFLMEKKMAAFLDMLPPNTRGSLGSHLEDVMAAVKSRDCSVFLCNYGIKEIPVPR